ncbi:unnamed protein product [Nippostrongylus brasiliensis]|uniref:BAG family molecular chaperone regulator 2 (inferred by orthology to a human protein) n=1 Tax=Nippostrongylus brasiliensis TaxID=27835 RepID=A0A0N4YXX1_NIPBR|nr:unnamed protein product [Nippostrongylus brasiliensis]
MNYQSGVGLKWEYLEYNLIFTQITACVCIVGCRCRRDRKVRGRAMAANAPRATTMTLIRNRSIDDFNEQVVNMLDEVEKRVEHLRETASLLEQEKEQILDMLNNVSLNTELLRLGQGDREDITAITNRLAARTKTVDVVVNTPRSAEQQRALTSVNGLIEGVVEKMQEDMSAGKEVCLEACRRYLNACNPDQPDGPIDQRFQAQVSRYKGYVF